MTYGRASAFSAGRILHSSTVGLAFPALVVVGVLKTIRYESDESRQ